MFGSKRNHDSPSSGVAKDEKHMSTSGLSNSQIKRATRTRRIWALLTSFLLLLSVIFLILVEVGNTNSSSSIRNSIYFIRLNLADIIPQTVPDATIVNSIAQTLGLHDFYQVGLWNFCQGYVDQGITDCSNPEPSYWFNPVEILLSQLLAGATIALPTNVTDILSLIRIVSHWMFGLFLTGACLSFVLIFLAPLAVFSRWAALPIALLSFVNALCIVVASVIATVLFVIMQHAFTSVADLNIDANIGTKMFVFMWIAAAAAFLAFLIQTCLMCCCASRRDVRTGRKHGSDKAYNTETPGMTTRRPGIFGSKPREA